MEEKLSAPLPLLPIDAESRNASFRSLSSIASSTGPFTTPKVVDNVELRISWQAAVLLSQINTDVLINKVPKLAGSFNEIEQVPIIKSYINLLLLLQEKDTDKQWITRFPYYQEDAQFLIEQVEPLIRVRNKFSFRVPYIYAFGLANDPKNELGLDFLLLDFIDGQQMPMWTEIFPAMSQKRQILEQIADIYLEMFTKPVTYHDRLVIENANNRARMQDDFDSFDIPPTQTATSYLTQLADCTIADKFGRLLADEVQERSVEINMSMEERLVDIFTLLMMRNSMSEIIIGRYNDSPFYITHPDLHNRNMIIEGEPVIDSFERTRKAFDTGEPSHTTRRPISTGMPSLENTTEQKLKLAGVVD